MRRSLLNKRILPKPLRQALVLITLLLLPSAAWGQGTFSTGNFQVTGDQSPYTYKWLIGTDNSDFWECDIENADVYCAGQDEKINQTKGSFNGSLTFNNPDNEMATSVSFNLNESRNRSITSITINLESVSSGVSISACGQNFTSLIEGENTLSLSHPRLWNDNFLITISLPHNSSVKINSLSIETGMYLGITVAEVPVTYDINDNDILGDGTVSFTAASGTNPAILTLKGATLGRIDESNTQNNYLVSIVSELDALTINLIGENKLYGTITCSSDNSTSDNATLAFTGSGSLEISGESSTINDFTSVDFGEFNLASKSAPGVHWSKNDKSLYGFEGPAHDVTITKASYYPIWVHGSSDEYATHTQLTEANTPISIGGGTISFDGEHTITVSTVNFNFEDNTMIVVGPDMLELTINLIRENSIRTGSSFLNLWDTTPLTFITNESEPGSLTAPTIVSWMPYNSQSQGGQISCENGLVYNAEANPQTISTDGVRLKIDNTEVSTTGNITIDNGTAHFNATTNTLTLTGATIGSASTSNIQVYVDKFNLEISGTCAINGNITYSGSNLQTSTIQIKKADNAGESSLTVSGISGFGDCSLGDGIYLSAENSAGVPTDIHYEPYGEEAGNMMSNYGEYSTITFSTTKPSESIWIGNTQVVDGSFTGIDGVSFDSEKNILTLNNAYLVSKGNIISSLPNLTIKLTGEDGTSEGRSDLDQNKYIISTNPSATLTFTTDGDNSLCSTIDNYELPWKGFAGNPTFENKLVFFQNSETMSIQVLQAPTMSYSSSDSDNKVTLRGLSHDNTQFSYYYAITYADNEGNISKTKKTLTRVEPNPATNLDYITITHTPFTVEASVIFEDQFGNITESETTIGKYFGFAESMILTTLASETEEKEIVLPALLPATEENDGITFELSSGNENIIYKNDDSKWMIKGYGNTSISAVIGTDDTTPFTVLNEGTSLVVNVLHDPIFTAYYGEDNTKVYDGNGSGNVSVEISSSDDDDLGSEYTLMYYLGTNNTTPTPYKDPISLNATTTVNAFIRYVNSANSSITYDSEPVSMEYLVSQKLETPAFEGNINFQTCYLKDYSLAKPAGLKVYIITEISLTDNTLKAVSIDYIPKGVPVLLEKEGETPEGGYVAETYTGEVGEFSNNMLQYAEDDKDVTDTEFVLFNNEFVKATGIIAAGHCYLSLDGPHANTRGFSIDTSGNGTTGINHASLHDSREVMTKQWYDLQGRKIQKPTKAGLYIVNGKKVVIK